MKKFVIIVAGGKGERMKSKVPKQFLVINGLPLLMHTIRAFLEASAEFQFIVVLPEKEKLTWNQLCADYDFKIPHVLADGGPTRFHSVKSGLKKITDEEAIVAIHDAVRPVPDPRMILKVFETAELQGSAVPVVPVSESLRERTGAVSRSVDRSKYVVVQTPQGFLLSKLRNAYLQAYREDFTDDASVIERDGGTIHMVPGDPHNIKVTTPEDLKIAAALLCK